MRVKSLVAALIMGCLSAAAQPGPLQSYDVPIAAGTLAVPCFTPVALSYYPYHNGVRTDSTKHVFGTQLVQGTAATADRVLDVSSGGTYAYRNAAGDWTGTLSLLNYGRALLISNRHEARAISIEGYPADFITYIFPMPTGAYRCASARVASIIPSIRSGSAGVISTSRKTCAKAAIW